MPYEIRPNHPACPSSRPWGVTKKGDSKKFGCHATEESAKAQLRALYANDPEARHKMIDEAVATAYESGDDDLRAEVVLAAIRVAEIEETELDLDEPTPVAKTSLLDRFFEYITSDGQDATKSAIKRENNIDFPARDYAFVPDPALPSTWKLRLTESPGKVTLRQLGMAAAALSAGGFRGQRVQIPAAAVSAVKRRIRAEYRKLGVSEDKIPPAVKETTQFSIWKQADGQLRWLAVYSNCFRDDDYPPEIIAKESHELFVTMVDAGVVDYPELWHYHVPGTAWGKADWVGFADGFALASGTVYPGHEKEAYALADRDDIGVSHGMPAKYIMRDADDPSVIVCHVTTEISPLPMGAAANKMTGFFIGSKEQDEMPLSEQKKQHLIDVGIDPADIERLETGLKQTADLAAQAGIEAKEADAEPKGEAEEVKEGEATDAPATETPVTIETPVQQYLTLDEAKQTFAALVTAVNEGMQGIVTRVEALTTEVKSLKEKQAEVEAVKAQTIRDETPAMSLAEIISGTWSKQAEVDGRTSLAKSKPKEPDKKAEAITGLPFLDAVLIGQQSSE